MSKEIKDFAEKLGISLTFERIDSNPVMDRSDEMFNWRVTLICDERSESFNFSTGAGHIQAKPKNKWFPSSYYPIGQLKKASETSVYYNFKEKRFQPNFRGCSAYDIELYAKVFEAKPPSIDDVLGCLALDASVLDDTFANWCSNFGYDPDSRKAFNIWNACMDNTLRFKNLIGADNLEALRKIEY